MKPFLFIRERHKLLERAMGFEPISDRRVTLLCPSTVDCTPACETGMSPV